MARLYIVLGFLGVLTLFAYVAFAPTVPVWVRHLFHIVIGLLLIGLTVLIGWGVHEALSRVA